MTVGMINANQSINVLVVEDSLDCRVLLKTFLELNNCTVECTSDGSKALQMLQECEILPDIILLDLQMPNLDGYGFRKIQLMDSRLRDVPIVLMSGEDDQDKIDAEIQPDLVLQKPLAIRLLRDSLRDCLDSRRAS